MATLEEVKKVIDDFNHEVNEYLTDNKLVELPAFYELKDKDVFGTCFMKDQIYYEVLTGFKSNYFGLQSYLLKQLSSAERHEKYGLDALIVYVDKKTKELDMKLEAARSRLTFYKTISYIIGNVLYGAD